MTLVVPAPTSEPICKTKPLCARCTILYAIFYMVKKAEPPVKLRKYIPC